MNNVSFKAPAQARRTSGRSLLSILESFRFHHYSRLPLFILPKRLLRQKSTRYEKLAVSYLAVVHVAMIRLYLKRVCAALSDRT